MQLRNTPLRTVSCSFGLTLGVVGVWLWRGKRMANGWALSCSAFAMGSLLVPAVFARFPYHATRFHLSLFDFIQAPYPITNRCVWRYCWKSCLLPALPARWIWLLLPGGNHTVALALMNTIPSQDVRLVSGWPRHDVPYYLADTFAIIYLHRMMLRSMPA